MEQRLSPLVRMKGRKPGPRGPRVGAEKFLATSPVTPMQNNPHSGLGDVDAAAVSRRSGCLATVAETLPLPRPTSGLVRRTRLDVIREEGGSGGVCAEPDLQYSSESDDERPRIGAHVQNDFLNALRAKHKRKKWMSRGTPRGPRNAGCVPTPSNLKKAMSGERKAGGSKRQAMASLAEVGDDLGARVLRRHAGVRRLAAVHTGSAPSSDSEDSQPSTTGSRRPAVLTQKTRGVILDIDDDDDDDDGDDGDDDDGDDDDGEDLAVAERSSRRRRRLLSDSEESGSSGLSRGLKEHMGDPILEQKGSGSSSASPIVYGRAAVDQTPARFMDGGSRVVRTGLESRYGDGGMGRSFLGLSSQGRQIGMELLGTDGEDSGESTPVRSRRAATAGIMLPSDVFRAEEEDGEEEEEEDREDREEENDDDDDDDIRTDEDDDVFDADKQLAENQLELRRRGMQLGYGSSNSRVSLCSLERVPGPPLTLQETWVDYCHTLREDFLSRRSPAATMRDKSPYRNQKGVVQAYYGLCLTEDNNEDVRYIFKARFEPKYVRGQPISSYSQLRVCIGQFLRFCVVYKVVNIEDVWKKGELFRAVANLKMVKLFISSYQLRASPCTVLTKGIHLKTAALHGEDYFRDSRDQLNGSLCGATVDYLRNICAAEKTETRRGAARMQEEDARIELGKLLTGADFRNFTNYAMDNLKSIMRAVKGSPAIQGDSAASEEQLIEHLRQNQGMICKWCILFAGLVVFTGNGQRPHAYVQLQVPTHVDAAIRTWTDDAGPSFATSLEKTRRAAAYGRVSFPVKTREVMMFHLKVVRPALLGNTGVDPGSSSTNRSLLAHTKTGDPYRVGQLRATLGRFISGLYPEMGNITPQIVRSSFATWQFKLYQRGKTFQGQTSAQFLDKLSAMMNTSSEMLKTVYIAYGHEENEGQNAVARNLARTLDLEDTDEGHLDGDSFRNEGGRRGLADLGDEGSLSAVLL